MSKIVRLTESDLVRLVKRVMKEQAETEVPKGPVNNIGRDAWNMLKKAIEGPMTDEGAVKSACAMVTTPQIYTQLLANAKAEGNKNVMDYIMDDFGFGNGPVKTERTIRVNYDEWEHDEEVGELWSKDDDTQVPKFCAKVFMKFNKNEWNTFNNEVRVDKAV
jgi:hypothetical protein